MFVTFGKECPMKWKMIKVDYHSFTLGRSVDCWLSGNAITVKVKVSVYSLLYVYIQPTFSISFLPQYILYKVLITAWVTRGRVRSLSEFYRKLAIEFLRSLARCFNHSGMHLLYWEEVVSACLKWDKKNMLGRLDVCMRRLVFLPNWAALLK